MAFNRVSDSSRARSCAAEVIPVIDTVAEPAEARLVERPVVDSGFLTFKRERQQGENLPVRADLRR